MRSPTRGRNMYMCTLPDYNAWAWLGFKHSSCELWLLNSWSRDWWPHVYTKPMLHAADKITQTCMFAVETIKNRKQHACSKRMCYIRTICHHWGFTDFFQKNFRDKNIKTDTFLHSKNSLTIGTYIHKYVYYIYEGRGCNSNTWMQCLTGHYLVSVNITWPDLLSQVNVCTMVITTHRLWTDFCIIIFTFFLFECDNIIIRKNLVNTKADIIIFRIHSISIVRTLWWYQKCNKQQAWMKSIFTIRC